MGMQAAALDMAKIIAELEAMRAGEKTPFALVESSAAEVLQLPLTAEEKAELYFELAHIYAQSGHRYPHKTAEYAEKALGLPLDPVRQLRLYLYWGDALQVSEGKVQAEALVRVRKRALMPYIKGLKISTLYELPLKAPNLPVVSRLDDDGTDIPENHEARTLHQQQMEARKHARFQIDMIECRNILMNQIIYLYSRFPFATEELEGLAKETLGDSWLAGELVVKTKEEITKRTGKSTDALLDRTIASFGANKPVTTTSIQPTETKAQVGTTNSVQHLTPRALNLGSPGNTDAHLKLWHIVSALTIAAIVVLVAWYKVTARRQRP